MLFTDLVGSTEMTLRIGPTTAEEVRLEHFGILREAIGETGGEEVKNLGDGLMVTFGSASAALACAAMMQRQIARRNRRAEEPLSVRIGISLGEATRREDDYFGHPVIEASRLCAAAAGDEVLVSDLVRAMAMSGDHALEEVGELELKGMAEPVRAFRLAWASGDDESGFPLPPRLSRAPAIDFVGRARRARRAGGHRRRRRRRAPAGGADLRRAGDRQVAPRHPDCARHALTRRRRPVRPLHRGRRRPAPALGRGALPLRRARAAGGHRAPRRAPRRRAARLVPGLDRPGPGRCRRRRRPTPRPSATCCARRRSGCFVEATREQPSSSSSTTSSGRTPRPWRCSSTSSARPPIASCSSSAPIASRN